MSANNPIPDSNSNSDPSMWDILKILNYIPISTTTTSATTTTTPTSTVKPTLDQLRKCYQQRAKELHPDKNQNDPNAAYAFAQLKAAWDWISVESNYDDYIARLQQKERLLLQRSNNNGGIGSSSMSVSMGEQINQNNEVRSNEMRLNKMKQDVMVENNRYIEELRRKYLGNNNTNNNNTNKKSTTTSTSIDLTMNDHDDDNNNNTKKTKNGVNSSMNELLQQYVVNDPQYQKFDNKSSFYTPIFTPVDMVKLDQQYHDDKLLENPIHLSVTDDMDTISNHDNNNNNNINIDNTNNNANNYNNNNNNNINTDNTNQTEYIYTPNNTNIEFAIAIINADETKSLSKIKLADLVKNYDSIDPFGQDEAL